MGEGRGQEDGSSLRHKSWRKVADDAKRSAGGRARGWIRTRGLTDVAKDEGPRAQRQRVGTQLEIELQTHDPRPHEHEQRMLQQARTSGTNTERQQAAAQNRTAQQIRQVLAQQYNTADSRKAGAYLDGGVGLHVADGVVRVIDRVCRRQDHAPLHGQLARAENAGDR